MYRKLGMTSLLISFAMSATASCVIIETGCTQTSGRIATLVTGTKSYYCQHGDKLRLSSSTCAGIDALPPFAQPTAKIPDGDNKYVCKNGSFTMGRPIISPRGSHGNIWTCKSAA